MNSVELPGAWFPFWQMPKAGSSIFHPKHIPSQSLPTVLVPRRMWNCLPFVVLTYLLLFFNFLCGVEKNERKDEKKMGEENNCKKEKLWKEVCFARSSGLRLWAVWRLGEGRSQEGAREGHAFQFVFTDTQQDPAVEHALNFLFFLFWKGKTCCTNHYSTLTIFLRQSSRPRQQCMKIVISLLHLPNPIMYHLGKENLQ